MKDYFVRSDGSDEFTCKCGCGKNTFSPQTRTKLNRARAFANTPFIINSGCRCWKHNAKYDKRGTSSHLCEDKNLKPLPSCAADIRFSGSRQCFLIVDALMKVGFTRIGINFRKKFIHVDDDPNKDEKVLFSY